MADGRMSAPKTPAIGRDGRWEKLGEVGVDSATIAITDLLIDTKDWPRVRIPKTQSHYAVSEHAEDFGTGIRFTAGFGDGGYEIWGWIVDYGDANEPDERVAQVVITLITDDDLQDWQSYDD
ncbi:hypothetical protein FHT44_005182 [Mycolicibacterium sp. BK634]|nr:hypothetical protein [Mycolicibacterium sp. BK634]